MWLWAVLFFVLITVVFLVKAQFWVRQPVRLWWSVRPLQAKVDGSAPVKYLDHAHVTSCKASELEDVDALVAYIQTQSNEVYYPNAEHLHAYFAEAYASVYREAENETQNAIAGCIVSRPVELYVDKTAYRAFFHETMASERDDVSRRLIATHGLNLAKEYPNAPTIFTTTRPLMFVLPVVRYDVCWVQSRIFRKYAVPSLAYIKITERNVHIAVEWLKKHRFDFHLYPTTAQLVSWLRSKTASVYFVAQGGTMLGSFFFKNTWMVEKNKCVVDCCGAIFPHDQSLMYKAFSTLIYRSRRVNPIVRVHLSSDLMCFRAIPYFKKTNAYYYLYRYVGPANLAAKSCFIY
jgi:hypothetical protein